MTDDEVTEIGRIWQLELSRDPSYVNYLSEIGGLCYSDGVLKAFLESVLLKRESVVLLKVGGQNLKLRELLTESTATKKLKFSDSVLLFNPNMGLLLRSI